MQGKTRVLGLMLLLMSLMVPSPSSGTLYTLQAAHDSYVSSNSPDNNIGSYTLLFLNGGGAISRTYLRFDLSTIPAAEIITGATLYLSVYATTWNNVDLHHVSNDTWTEGTITWNYQPGYETAILADGTSTWDLMEKGNWTPDTDGAVSLLLKLGPEVANQYYYYYSKENRGLPQRPYLAVNTTVVPLPPAGLLLGVGLLCLVGLEKG